MIYIYGDSHARFNFKGLTLPNLNQSTNSITMHRIGRDKKIVNCDPKKHKPTDVVVVCYGEIDCRCHIFKQVNQLKRSEDQVIQMLVDAYFETLKLCLKNQKTVVVCAVVPPTRSEDYEKVNGKIKHEFGFLGSNEYRVKITNKVNDAIKIGCQKAGYIYFDPFDQYKMPGGYLQYSFSDNSVHIKQNQHILEEFAKIIAK